MWAGSGAIVGPTYGGVPVAIGTGTNWQLAAFAAPAAVGAILTVLVPQRTPIHRSAQTRRPSAARMSIGKLFHDYRAGREWRRSQSDIGCSAT
ncbi:hypothetical protein FND50_20585 [Rhodococcus sp. WB9]|nr:hypothetical protein FND50_20585 [Rhodococcus sp. WB9]